MKAGHFGDLFFTILAFKKNSNKQSTFHHSQTPNIVEVNM
jgi:hypothetical protein